MRDYWHILTGEYPPQHGGVSDYTFLLAEGLAKEGEKVHVWTSQCESETPAADNVTVHRTVNSWVSKDLQRLNDALNEFPAPRSLLVQYAPNAWGRKGLNFDFCSWLLKRSELGDDVRLMVHEPFYPWRLWDKPTRWILAAGQRRMMRTLLKASSQVYISIPAWEKLLRPFAKSDSQPMTWLPIYSTIPVVENEEAVATARSSLAKENQFVVGSFGTFGGDIERDAFEIFLALLSKNANIAGALLGRGGERVAQRLCEKNASFKSRLFAPGSLSAEDISIQLQACDLLVQPYPDGISSRRTSAMAGLAHGLPMVTAKGVLSEPFWVEKNCVALIDTSNNSSFVTVTESLLTDEVARKKLGQSALVAYDEMFSLKRTIAELTKER
jgi:glycosyltransferase involved in cell wall biosynthesis